MFDQFEKLRGFESQAGQNYADWNSLQERLNATNKKRFGWLQYGIAVILILIPFAIGEIYFITNTDVKIASLDDNIKVETVKSLESNNDIETNELNVRSNNVSVAVNSNASVTPSSTMVTETVKSTTPAISKEKPVHPKSNIRIAHLPLAAFELESAVAPNRNWDSKFELPGPKEVYPNSFDLEIGLQSSISNNVSNVASQKKGWGTGILVNARYNIGKHLSFGLGSGVQSEFNQDINYSFITESRSFFSRSDKLLNINTTQMYSANFLLTSSFRWNKRFITGGGIYYNYIFQSMSKVHESGTGSFADVSGPVMNKTGYVDLLNNHELGLYLSQSYMFTDNWGLTLSLRRGLTNRLNTAYFPGIENKRTELSLMISKRIRL